MTKRAHFIPYHKATGAEATAHLFSERYFPLHGIPGAIVSDRDKRFVNDFWQAFTKEVGTDIRLSSSAHPETDGQTEKANDVVGVHLKCFVTRYVTTGTDKQDCKGWHRLLPLAEFAYNATPQKALGRSPFEVDLGYIPPSKIELIGAAIGARSVKESARSKQGKEFAEHMEALLLAAKDDLEAARDAQRADANTKRRDHDFQEGDMVLLDAPKDHMTYSNPVPGSSKLQHRYGGPHRIIWVRGTAAKLDLGTDLPIHPVFHVSRLRHDTTDRERPQEPIPPLRLAKDGGGVCELKTILEHSTTGTNKKNTRYLVEWDDYTGDTAWLELDGLRDARELVEEYHRKHGLGPVDWEAKRRSAAAKARKKRKEYWG
jgi:putative transposase